MTLPYRSNVGILLRKGCDPAGRLLIGHRIGSAMSDGWQVPQGGLDDEPGIIRAAVRELGEEIGVTDDLLSPLRICPDPFRYDLPAQYLETPRYKGKYAGQEQTWILIDFLGQDEDIHLDTPEPEFDAWQWATAQDVLRQAAPFKRSSYIHAMQRLLDPNAWAQISHDLGLEGETIHPVFEPFRHNRMIAEDDLEYLT